MAKTFKPQLFDSGQPPHFSSCPHTQIYIHTHTGSYHLCTHSHTHTCTHSYTILTQTHVNTHTLIYTHTHTHTHTYLPCFSQPIVLRILADIPIYCSVDPPPFSSFSPNPLHTTTYTSFITVCSLLLHPDSRLLASHLLQMPTSGLHVPTVLYVS